MGVSFYQKCIDFLNIYKAFKTTRIWSLKPTTMKSKMQPSEQFMEIKAYEPIGATFNFKSKRF